MAAMIARPLLTLPTSHLADPHSTIGRCPHWPLGFFIGTTPFPQFLHSPSSPLSLATGNNVPGQVRLLVSQFLKSFLSTIALTRTCHRTTVYPATETDLPWELGERYDRLEDAEELCFQNGKMHGRADGLVKSYFESSSQAHSVVVRVFTDTCTTQLCPSFPTHRKAFGRISQVLGHKIFCGQASMGLVSIAGFAQAVLSWLFRQV